MTDRHESHTVSGMVLTDHHFALPLDYSLHSDSLDPHDSPFASATIKIFARHAISVKNQSLQASLPFLVYLQGGPGFESPRPVSHSGWLKVALESYQVLLLDQRGTGMSSPITHGSLAAIGSSSLKADFLKFFRADSIVRDAEEIRKVFMGKVHIGPNGIPCHCQWILPCHCGSVLPMA